MVDAILEMCALCEIEAHFFNVGHVYMLSKRGFAMFSCVETT